MKPDTTLDDMEGLMNSRFTGEVWGTFQGVDVPVCHMINGEIVPYKKYYDHKFSSKLESLTDD